MANSESRFKTELINHTRERYPRSHIFAVTDKFMSGVPDVYAKVIDHEVSLPSMWLELKFLKIFKGPVTHNYPVNLTALQRRWIGKENEAGGFGVWVLCVKVGKEEFLYASRRGHAERTSVVNLAATRRAGTPWDIFDIYAKLEG